MNNKLLNNTVTLNKGVVTVVMVGTMVEIGHNVNFVESLVTLFIYAFIGFT